MTRIVHNAGSTFLFASFGFMVASAVAYNTGFRSWSDDLTTAAFWNGALAVALYALQIALQVGQGVARLIASRRRAQP